MDKYTNGVAQIQRDGQTDREIDRQNGHANTYTL
jgi:hypothetical protein